MTMKYSVKKQHEETRKEVDPFLFTLLDKQPAENSGGKRSLHQSPIPQRFAEAGLHICGTPPAVVLGSQGLWGWERVVEQVRVVAYVNPRSYRPV